MRKLNMCLICCERKMDQLIHGFDVFEPFKVLAQVHHLTGNLQDEVTQAQALKNIRDSFEKEGTYRVVALFVPGDPDGALADTSVKAISNGNKFCKFKDLLLLHGYAGDINAIA